ncbi:2-nitropropane dioxygenase precursor [Pyrenophora seminiperda CCB06]|uniref:2-nitropropane dioxygenase n=1 Tax=Pyrenophora seminiperda CCB06 TaxID=1302712 RepID=A0A3M7MAQ9_9PLEO|nr:2-nitropropane dioxygenase precursor [Pyrenophora seminiperda CCB06]
MLLRTRPLGSYQPPRENLSSQIIRHIREIMGDETRANGFLSDLQKLDEAGRDRILSLLPAEDVILILKASLRERDRYEVNHQGNTPAADVGMPNRTVTSGPNLSAADVSHAALELNTTAARTNKRKRIIDPDSDDEDDEVYTTRSYPTKKREHITDPDSEEHDEDSSASIVSPEKSGNERIQPSMLPKPDVHIEPLHLHVKIPVANGRIGIKEIPAAIRTELEFRFEKMCTSSKGRVVTYRSIL